MSGPTVSLSGSALNGSITVAWTVSDKTNVTRYDIIDVTDPDFPTQISTTADPNFTGPEVFPALGAQVYTFEVRVFAGSTQIAVSNQLTIANPIFISSNASSDNGIATIEWTVGPSGDYYYTVFQETNGEYLAISEEFAAVSPFIVSGLTNDITYNFKIYAFTAQNPESYINTSSIVSATYQSDIPCFPTGTLIRTVVGDKPVETLATGDYVRTADNRAVPVRMYSFHVAKATEANAPYVVPANSLGHRQPARTLHLSPHHAFQIKPNVWQMPLLAAERSEAITQYDLGEPVTYYHVECPNFFRDNLVADGVVCESFGSNQTKGLKGIYRFAPALGGYTRVSGPTFAKRSVA